MSDDTPWGKPRPEDTPKPEEKQDTPTASDALFTLNAAEMLDMGEELGSLDVGKDADLVVFEGHPFDYRALPVLVYIDGKLTVRPD